MARRIAPGSRVTIDFTISLADGTVVETTADQGPQVFQLGSGDLDPGLESYLVGLEEGQRARLDLAPGDAFGDPDPAGVHMMPRTDFPAGLEPVAGQVIEFVTPAGASVPGTVMELLPDSVLVDFNHPLAGRALRVDLLVIEVSDAS